MQSHLFHNLYKGTSMRLPQRDYKRPGGYFVTLCTKHRKHFFGDVMDGEMQLSTIGHIAEQCWQEIPDHCLGVRIDEYVVMPNHVHGILIIERCFGVEAFHGTSPHQNSPRERLFTPNRKLLPFDKPSSLSQTMSAISPKRGSLSTIIRSYKSSVTRWCRQNGYSHFAWQPRFYEHVIRADGSINYIRRYIVNNPSNWQCDRNNVQKFLPPTSPPTITSPSPTTSV